MRLAFNLGIVFSIVFLPWYVTALFIFVACLAVRNFYESVAYGIAMDALYGTAWGFHGFAYLFSAGAAAALAISLLLQGRVSWD